MREHGYFSSRDRVLVVNAVVLAGYMHDTSGFDPSWRQPSTISGPAPSCNGPRFQPNLTATV